MFFRIGRNFGHPFLKNAQNPRFLRSSFRISKFFYDYNTKNLSRDPPYRHFMGYLRKNVFPFIEAKYNRGPRVGNLSQKKWSYGDYLSNTNPKLKNYLSNNMCQAIPETKVSKDIRYEVNGSGLQNKPAGYNFCISGEKTLTENKTKQFFRNVPMKKYSVAFELNINIS